MASRPTGANASSRTSSSVDESSEVSELNFLLNGGSQSSKRGERQRQQEHFRQTMPPTGNELRVMAVQQAVEALVEHRENAQVVIGCCERWQALGYGPGRRQSAAEAGALAAIVEGMRAHKGNATVQEKACLAIANICSGTDENGLGRKAQAFDAGGVVAVVEAFAAHPESAAVHATGAAALGNICYAADGGLERKHAAYNAGAIPPLCAAMERFASDAAMCENGAFALGNLCRSLGKVGGSESGIAPIEEQMRLRDEGNTRKQCAADHGALEALVAAMKTHDANKGIGEWGSRALSIITFESPPLRERAKKAGAKMQWLMGLSETMDIAQKAKAAPVSKTGRPPMATMPGGGASLNVPATGRARIGGGSVRGY